MLLGAVVPELRSETEALALDLAELVRLRSAITADRDGLAGQPRQPGDGAAAPVGAGRRAGRFARRRREGARRRAAARRRPRPAGRHLEGPDRPDGDRSAGAAHAADEARKAEAARRKAAAAESDEVKARARRGAVQGPGPAGAGRSPSPTPRACCRCPPPARIAEIVRRSGRVRRHGEGHFDRHATAAPMVASPTDGWVVVFRPLPNLWTTLDHQCRAAAIISCSRAWIGSTSTSVSSSWRASRSPPWATGHAKTAAAIAIGAAAAHSLC